MVYGQGIGFGVLNKMDVCISYKKDCKCRGCKTTLVTNILWENKYLLTETRKKFIEKVAMPQEDINESCWNWTRYLKHNVYGKFALFSGIIGDASAAHRVSWILFRGPINPQTLVIRHLCHNTKCVNPNHLLPGTMKENMADSAERYFGENNPRAKANNELVLKIREDHATGLYSLAQLSKIHGLAKPTISEIVRRKSWKHI